MSEDDYGQRKLPRPDWDRVRVDSRATQTNLIGTKVGDPIRWGGQIEQLLVNNPAGGLILPSDQFIRTQPQDTYTRVWSISGTIKLPQAAWATPNVIFMSRGLPTANTLGIVLEVVTGAGQSQQFQYIDLRALTTEGLARYLPLVDIGAGLALVETRAFSLYGALIGSAMSMRVFFLEGQNVAFGANNLTAVVNLNVSPLAPGQGM